MSPGKKTRVVISCVTFETVKVIDPILNYRADEAHLIHYLRDDVKNNIYLQFYQEVCRQLKKADPGINIVEHNDVPVYDFGQMLSTVLDIEKSMYAKYGEKTEVYVNITSGTSEYVAAATMAAMMVPGVRAFTVSAREYTVSPEQVKDIYFKDGKPVGLTKYTCPPKEIAGFEILMPEENCVRCLRCLSKMTEAKESTTAKRVIARFKEKGLWNYSTNPNLQKTGLLQRELMYYKRHYINVWARNGWIYKTPGKSKYDLTEEGNTIITTFYNDIENTKTIR